MPPKKRKAAEAIANDDDDGDRATSAKKSKKEAAEAARARAKAWRDSRRQQQEAASTKKTTAAAATTTTPPSSPPPPAPAAAPFSTGRQSPRRTTSSTSKTTTASKRRRTPVKRGAAASTPSSTRKSSTKSPLSQQKQPAKRSRRNIATDFQFDSSALDQNTQTAAVADHDAAATAATLLSDSKKKKQQEGKARIEELRKKRQQSGLKVTSPVSDTKKKSDSQPMSMEEEEEEEEDIETLPTKSTAAFKTVLVSPGKIGLTLDGNTINGGASITAVDPSCSLIGQVDVGDIIVSIDGTRITSINDFQVNAHKVRRFGIVPRNNRNGSSLDPPSSNVGRVSVAAAASTVTNSKTGVDPPPTSTSTTAPTTAAASAAKKRTMPAAVANIFSQPKTNNITNNAHRPDASLKYDPNQPFPTQGYKMSTAAYCGCGPTPSNRSHGGGGGNSSTVDLNSTATRVARSGSGTLQQLRESMRNAPPVKRASLVNEDDDDDQKMPAASSLSTTMKPSPPGRNGSAPDVAASSSPEEDNNDASILKASISRAQQLVSSVAFTNRKRREQLGIKSDSTKTVKSLPMQKMTSSPTADPPNSAPDVEETVDDIIRDTMIGATMEESEVHWETPQISFFRKMINGIYSLFKLLLILPVAVGVIYVLGSMRGDATLKSTTATDGSDVALDQVVCFMDYPSDFYSPGESENITKHDDVCGGVYNQCPQWGRCHGGLLRDCNGGGEWGGLALFVPNEAGTSCVPSDGATVIVKIVQDALVNMTVSQSCRSSDMITDSKSVASGAPHPLFSLDVVSWRVNEASEVDITLSANLLLLFQPVFDPEFVTFGHLSGEDTESTPDAIGLSSEVLEHKLPIPFSCQLKFVFMELFGASLKILYRIIMFLALKGWKYISTHPKSSPVVMLVLVSVVIVRRKKKHRAKVREIFDVVKEEAYDRLAHCEGSGGYAALHLRDDVGHAMYPSNVRERLFMYNYVWPRMIVEVRADNRVRKFRKTADGKQLEHWDLNTNSKRGWQLRKTPNKSPNKSPTKTVEPVGKRDP